MKPSEKSPEINGMLKEIFGFDREETILSNKCVPPPCGCGKDINPETEFSDELSRKEYTISGFCQACQDKVFGD